MGGGAEDESITVNVVVFVGASEEEDFLLVGFDGTDCYSGGEVGRLDLNVLTGS